MSIGILVGYGVSRCQGGKSASDVGSTVGCFARQKILNLSFVSVNEKKVKNQLVSYIHTYIHVRIDTKQSVLTYI